MLIFNNIKILLLASCLSFNLAAYETILPVRQVQGIAKPPSSKEIEQKAIDFLASYITYIAAISAAKSASTKNSCSWHEDITAFEDNIIDDVYAVTKSQLRNSWNIAHNKAFNSFKNGHNLTTALHIVDLSLQENFKQEKKEVFALSNVYLKSITDNPSLYECSFIKDVAKPWRQHLDLSYKLLVINLKLFESITVDHDDLLAQTVTTTNQSATNFTKQATSLLHKEAYELAKAIVNEGILKVTFKKDGIWYNNAKKTLLQPALHNGIEKVMRVKEPLKEFTTRELENNKKDYTVGSKISDNDTDSLPDTFNQYYLKPTGIDSFQTALKLDNPKSFAYKIAFEPGFQILEEKLKETIKVGGAMPTVTNALAKALVTTVAKDVLNQVITNLPWFGQQNTNNKSATEIVGRILKGNNFYYVHKRKLTAKELRIQQLQKQYPMLSAETIKTQGLIVGDIAVATKEPLSSQATNYLYNKIFLEFETALVKGSLLKMKDKQNQYFHYKHPINRLVSYGKDTYYYTKKKLFALPYVQHAIMPCLKKYWQSPPQSNHKIVGLVSIDNEIRFVHINTVVS